MKVTKVFLTIALTMLVSIGGYAQKTSYKKQGKPDALGWYVATEKKKFGYVDSVGNIVVPIVYDKVEHFIGNFACVQKGKTWGIVNRLGKEICPPLYEEIENFWIVLPNFAQVKRGGKWGFINAEGKEVIPAQYEKFVFDEGFAPLKGNGKIGFIDINCNTVVPAVYDDCTWFSHGSAAVKQNGRWGFVDSKGNVIIPITLNYDQVGAFNEGLIPVRKGKQWGYIDASNNVVIPVKLNYDEAYNFSSGMARVRKGGKYGFIDKTGNVVIKPSYIAAADFIGEVAIVSKKNSTMFWLSMANSVAQQAAASTTYFSNQVSLQSDMALTSATGGQVDDYKVKQRQTAIQQQFQNDLRRAHAAAPKSGGGKVYQLGMIDKTGKELIPLKYGILSLEQISGSKYVITQWHMTATGDGWRYGLGTGPPVVGYGFYDVEKKPTNPPLGLFVSYLKFDMATFAEKEWIVVAGVETNRILAPIRLPYGIIDYSGKVIIPLEHDIFDPIVFVLHEMILVGDVLKRKGGKMLTGYDTPNDILEATYGIIDYSGKVIIPKTECKGIGLIDNEFVMTLKDGAKRYFDLNGQEIRR